MTSVALFAERLSRSDKHINDLVPDVLLEIFGNFPADFRLETLRSVCSLWREIIDRTFSSINSIQSIDSLGTQKFSLSFFQSSANLTETCLAGNLRFYLQASALNLKKIHLDDRRTSRKFSVSTFRAIENCRNLTELWLYCDLTLCTEQLNCTILPELHTLALQHFGEIMNYKNSHCLQSSVASFLVKHRKIENLSFHHFNPGMNSYAAIGHLKLKQFKFQQLFSLECVEPLFESLKLSSKSLESLRLVGPVGRALSEQPFPSLAEDFCLTQKLTSLHVECSWVGCHSPISAELLFFSLKGLLSLKSLSLYFIDFTSEPKLPQNREKLTAGQLLAPMLQNLTVLKLRGHFDDRFFRHAFSTGLIKLKKLFVSELTKLSMENLLNHWCPNLEEFGTCENLGVECLSSLHQIVHSCALVSSAKLNPGILPERQLLVDGSFYCRLGEMLEELKLCGLKFVCGKGILISRSKCF